VKLAPVLTIAGSDSSGGAGLQADLKAFTVLGAYGMSVVTALTAQNTKAVTRVFPVPPDWVWAQLEAIWADIPPRAIKTGMLAHAEIIEVVQRFLTERANGLPLVVDPVLVAASGARLLDPQAETALLSLCAQATVVTPNLPEAAALMGQLEPQSEAEALQLGQRLSHTYPQPYWVLKGGHASWEKHTLTSWVFRAGRLVQRHVQPRLALPKPPHGTGCTFASAVAALLAQGTSIPVAIGEGLHFVHRALQTADPTLGEAATVLNPLGARPYLPT